MQQQLRRRQEPRQQQLRFARQEVWKGLPEAQREQCHRLLVELLIGVIRAGSRQGGEHER
jgi:hypothetical protein